MYVEVSSWCKTRSLLTFHTPLPCLKKASLWVIVFLKGLHEECSTTMFLRCCSFSFSLLVLHYSPRSLLALLLLLLLLQIIVNFLQLRLLLCQCCCSCGCAFVLAFTVSVGIFYSYFYSYFHFHFLISYCRE